MCANWWLAVSEGLTALRRRFNSSLEPSDSARASAVPSGRDLHKDRSAQDRAARAIILDNCACAVARAAQTVEHCMSERKPKPLISLSPDKQEGCLRVVKAAGGNHWHLMLFHWLNFTLPAMLTKLLWAAVILGTALIGVLNK